MIHFAISTLLLRKSEDDVLEYQLMLMPILACDAETAEAIAVSRCSLQYPDYMIQNMVGLEMEAFIYVSRSVH